MTRRQHIQEIMGIGRKPLPKEFDVPTPEELIQKP
jgi:hypothetical protein